MDRKLFYRAIILLVFIFHPIFVFSTEENFLLINGTTNETLFQVGPNINRRMSPCSTFKITLSLMGYDADILKDENNPTWDFEEGYDDWLAAWRITQTPESWMKFSCVWYSKLLSLQLGLKKMHHVIICLKFCQKQCLTIITRQKLSHLSICIFLITIMT